MRVLHLFEHAVLRPTDYARRALALLDGLRGQGVQTVQIAGPADGAGAASALPPGWQFYRTPAPVGCPACRPACVRVPAGSCWRSACTTSPA
jgi:hypothetical protein